MIPPLVHFFTNYTYYLWDVLTTASVGNRGLVKVQSLNSIVHADGPSQSHTFETADGQLVNAVHDVNRDAFLII